LRVLNGGIGELERIVPESAVQLKPVGGKTQESEQ